MIRLACIQPEILHQIDKSYSEVEKILNSLIKHHNNCDIICLPERWISPINEKELNVQKERGSSYKFIKNLAKEYGIGIISGALWEKRKDTIKPRITSYFFDNNGDEINRQDKIHLYSYEKLNFEPGKELVIFSFKKISFTILICFDMAFFETPRLSAENGADLLFSPTQISVDGMLNWKTYLKTRALENRIPIVACNTFGTIIKRKFPGNSKIISFEKDYISPSKLRVIEGPIDTSGYIYDEIDLAFPKKLRKLRFKEIIDKNAIIIRKTN